MKRSHLGLVLLPYLLATAVVFILELFSQRSLSGAIGFVVGTPHFFLLNIFIVALTLVPSLFIRRRFFYDLLVSTVWILLGVTNFILQSIRETPFEPTDLYILSTGFDIVGHYLKPWMIVLIILLFALFFAFLGALFVKSKKHPRHLFRGLISLATVAVLCFGLGLFLNLSGRIADRFPNLCEAYRTYGFSYCFCNAIFDRGINEPPDYSEEVINQYAEAAGLGTDPALPDELPNIIYVQLETFFNVNRLKNLTFSENPIPNFTALSASSASGLLSVPALGAGTANTEFEVLTGMDLASFGAGEYPYKTILLANPCESTAYVLSDIGYATHAVHNNAATFYDRHICYSNLGFQTFTSIEYMNNLTFNALDWAEDRVLTGEISAALNSTAGSDFIFTVSVQGHGGYPSKVIDETQTISITSGIDDVETLCGFEYYVNQLYRMDQFVGELIAALSAREEKTIVVFYGDHLPGGLGITLEDLSSGTLYETEYVLWTNYGDSGTDRDLEAYQLSAAALELAGIERGNVFRLHQTCSENENYPEMLEAFEYDLLYGEQYLTGGTPAYTTVSLTYGVHPIVALTYTQETDGVRITGSNFTEHSRLIVTTASEAEDEKKIGRDPYETTLDADGSLFASGVTLEDGDLLAVGQYTDEDVFLSRTDLFTYHP